MRFVVIVSLLALLSLGAWIVPKWTNGTSAATIYLQDGREFDSQQIEFLMKRFAEEGIEDADAYKGKVQVPIRFRTDCNRILASAEFLQLDQKKKNPAAGLSNPFTPPSEKARLAKEAKIQELANTLERIYGIREARIMHDQLKSQSFSRKMIQTASITLWAEEGETIRLKQADTARMIVCNAFAGLEKENVCVVDGDSCLAFYAQPGETDNVHSVNGLSENAKDLDADRHQLEQEFQKVLVKFGAPQIVVRMEQEKRVEVTPAPPKSQPRTTNIDSGEAVPNGTGSIRKSLAAESPQAPLNPPKTILINRLLGVEVGIQHEAVVRYIQQQLGISDNISEQQFSRGMVTVRNEITKDLVRWLRRQKGIEAGSDLISVSVLPAEDKPAEVDEATTSPWPVSKLMPLLAGFGIVIVGLILITSWKARSPRKLPSRNEQLSDGGRAFVTRNQTNPGRELADEASEVVHAAPAESARAFQNLVSGEAGQ